MVSSLPCLISSITHVLICWERRTLLKLLSAAVTAETCVMISVQYASFSIMPLMPRIWPSMRLKRFIKSLYSFSERDLVRFEQHGQMLLCSMKDISTGFCSAYASFLISIFSFPPLVSHPLLIFYLHNIPLGGICQVGISLFLFLTISSILQQEKSTNRKTVL